MRSHWSTTAREYVRKYESEEKASKRAKGEGKGLGEGVPPSAPAATAEPDWLLGAAKCGGNWRVRETSGDALVLATQQRQKEKASAKRVAREHLKRAGNGAEELATLAGAEESTAEDALPAKFAGAQTSLELWCALRDEEAIATAARRSALSRLAELLSCEVSNNSQALVDDLYAKLKVQAPTDDSSAMDQLKEIERSIAPLWEDAQVGRRYADDRSPGDVQILFKIPEEGDDEALFVYGALLEPAVLVSGVVSIFPRWAVSEWDESDLAKAKPAGRAS